MRIFNFICCGLFILFAVLQYNDPDPYLWIPIYGYGAVVCWLAFRGRYYRRACLVGMIGFLAYAIILFFEEDGVWDWLTKHKAANIAATMQADKPWIEDTREFFGLVILMVVMGINYFYARKKV